MPGTSLLCKEWNAGLHPAPSPQPHCQKQTQKKPSSGQRHSYQRKHLLTYLRPHNPKIWEAGRGQPLFVILVFIELKGVWAGCGLLSVNSRRGGRVTSYNPPMPQETCLNKRAGEIGHWLFLRGLRFHPQEPQGALQLSLIPVPGNLMLFPGLPGHQASKLHADLHASKTLIHVRLKQKLNKSKTGLRCLNA